MASREFTDDRGEVWQVWHVDPESLERRITEDPHLTPTGERRSRPESRLKVSNPLMANGWLAFESRMERRRLAPVPDGWAEMDQDALRALLARAAAAAETHRILK